MRLLATLLLGIICLAVGVGVGVCYGPQIKSSPPAQQAISYASKVPGLNTVVQPDPDSPYEIYNYPMIKWRAKPLSDAPGGIAQLSTEYESDGHGGGKMNYRLTMFKANGKQQCEVQLLDPNGFKIGQFIAADFHTIPGAPDVIEARDSYACSENDYKKAHDYSIK